MKSPAWILLSLIPAALGAAAAALFSTGWVPDPAVHLGATADIAGLALSAGLLLSAITALLLWWAWRRETRCRRQMDRIRANATADRYRFMQRLDHELKNPLQAVGGSLTNIAAEALSPDQQKALDIAKSQVQRMVQLVRDMRKVSMLERGAMERESVDLVEMLEDTAALAREGYGRWPAIAGGRPLQLTVRDTPLPAVTGDRELLQNAVYNLVDNACKFSPAGTPVEVLAWYEEPWVYIAIIDRGMGIPAEDLPHMGEELYRGSVSRAILGSGLGLTMVRTIVRRHGGTLEMQSQVGQGTTAIIRLPAEGKEPARRTYPPGPLR